MSARAFSQLLIAVGVALAAVAAAVLWMPGVLIVAVVCLVGGLLVNVEDGERESTGVVHRTSK